MNLDKLEALAKAVLENEELPDSFGASMRTIRAATRFGKAADPATVLALIARARRAESLLLRCRERLDAHKDSDDLWEEINSCLTTPT